MYECWTLNVLDGMHAGEYTSQFRVSLYFWQWIGNILVVDCNKKLWSGWQAYLKSFHCPSCICGMRNRLSPYTDWRQNGYCSFRLLFISFVCDSVYSRKWNKKAKTIFFERISLEIYALHSWVICARLRVQWNVYCIVCVCERVYCTSNIHICRVMQLNRAVRKNICTHILP